MSTTLINQLEQLNQNVTTAINTFVSKGPYWKLLNLNNRNPLTFKEILELSELESIPNISSKGISNDLHLFSIISGNIDPYDIVQLLTPSLTETLLVIPMEWRFPQLMKSIGCFDSTSLASKNGWNKDIPIGFNQFTVKVPTQKVKAIITILKIPGL